MYNAFFYRQLLRLSFLFMLPVVISPANSCAQVFDNIAEDLGLFFTTNGGSNGSGISFYDFDHDGWDDLTVLLANDSLRLYKNVNGWLEQIPSIVDLPGDAKHATWVDYDNDGDSDLFITRFGNTPLLLQNQGDMEMIDVSSEAGFPTETEALSYGASWGDYDRDGWLDVYICNFDWPDGNENWLYHNNQDGSFTEVAVEMGVEDGYRPSFQSSWMDYDHDLWPDLHVINDRYLINSLYHNDQGSGFSDSGEELGANLEMNSMSTTVGDYDNDGDLDIYITNNANGNALLKYVGANGGFDEVAEETGVLLQMMTWGALWIDYDNDRWRDLFVASTNYNSSFENMFMLNNEGVFVQGTDMGTEADLLESFSVAQGDLDRDGFPDFAVHNGQVAAHFYHNQSTEGNSLTITLHGVESNADGIGTWISSYINGDVYTTYTMCGSNYMGQDSQHMIIPMAEAEIMDSLILEWPSGMIDVHYNLPAGTFLDLVEGYSPEIEVLTESGAEFCTGMTVDLSATAGFDNYQWSNGDTTQAIVVSMPGYYSVSSSHSGGIVVVSDSIFVSEQSPIDLDVEIVSPGCYGFADGSISMSSDEGELIEVLWSGGQEGAMLSFVNAGTFIYTVIDENECVQVDTLEVMQPDSLWVEWQSTDVLCYGDSSGTLSLDIHGGTPDYSIESTFNSADSLVAGWHEVTLEDAHGCLTTFAFEISEPEELSVIVELQHSSGTDGHAQATGLGGIGSYFYGWSTGEEGQSIANLSPGSYWVNVSDDNGCESFLDFEILLVDLIGDSGSRQPINLFPNPAYDQINVRNINPESIDKITVVDSSGRLVLRQNGFPLSISQLNFGHYFVQILKVDGSMFILEFIK
jgi:hypothetical protein